MCLYKVHKRPLTRGPVIAWKHMVPRSWSGRGMMSGDVRPRPTYRAGVLVKDQGDHSIVADDGAKYPTGFHAYRYPPPRLAMVDHIRCGTFRAVRLFNIVATGEQEGRPVFVGRSMIVLSKRESERLFREWEQAETAKRRGRRARRRWLR